MTLQLLISCMHQKDASIVQRSNIQSDCIIVNQCDEDKIEELQMISDKGKPFNVKMIYTTERGLSKSRNMALRNATADICLICDDDETFEDGYEQIILDSYRNNPNADIITFKINCSGKSYKQYSYKLGRFTCAGISSWQISFRREKQLANNVWFDEKMGSGTGNGPGEESKFMYQMICRGAKAIFVPKLISSVAQTESQWFHGYTKKYFIDRGWISKRIFGLFYGYLYMWYHNVRRFNIYKNSMSFWNITRYTHQGFFTEKR